jgi:hypothetical protein
MKAAMIGRSSRQEGGKATGYPKTTNRFQIGGTGVNGH